MPNHDNRPVHAPAAEIAAFELCRQRLIQELDDIRLALCALNLDAPREAKVAFLHIIDGQLKRMRADAEAGLSSFPNWLHCQT
ncbi:hypothetical protein [uncultured Microbulbifer sp.]|uniref:hypothetical protein n=1 Tax=uncultured Microbulbifer sp. TaxID=348147 RepID=UPI002605CB20|nr:hypothetical protein [uncultured Microbulbifer sp.]